MIRFKETQALSVFVRSKLPDADYVVNLYTGCAIGCSYCYASFMGRFVGEPMEDWGNYVYAKANAIQVLRKELARLSPAEKKATVFLSSVTDPYQPLESKYQLTRRALQTFIDFKYTGNIGVLTKSILVTRDMDLFKQLPSLEVGMTITTTDDKLAHFLEPRTSVTTERLKALERLVKEGIRVYAFVGPLLPHFRYAPELLEDLFRRLSEVGVREIYAEHLNVKAYILKRLSPAIQQMPREVQAVYAMANTGKHKEAVSKMVLSLVKKYNLVLRLGRVVDHGR